MDLKDWAKGSILQSGLNMAGGLLSHGLSMRAWRKMNEYNTPSKQMNRFRNAGLNPNLIYSQGNAGNAGLPPKADAGPKTGLPDVPGMKAKTGLLASQINLNEAQAYAALANGERSEAEVLRIMEMMGFEKAESASRTARNEQSVIQSKHEVNEINARIRETDQRINESQERVLNLAASREQIKASTLNTELQNAFDEIRNEYQGTGIQGNKWLQFLYQVGKAGNTSLQNMLIDFMSKDKKTISYLKGLDWQQLGEDVKWNNLWDIRKSVVEYLKQPSNLILHPGR